MENASKALLMAGGVLLGIMIISLGVLLFTNFGGTSSRIHDNIEANQIAQFNSQFTQYVGKENVTIYDVITMANLATENNKYYEFPKKSFAEIKDNENYITVLLGGVQIEYGYGNAQSVIEQDYNKRISDQVNAITGESSELQKYAVQVELSEITRRVYIVRCTAL